MARLTLLLPATTKFAGIALPAMLAKALGRADRGVHAAGTQAQLSRHFRPMPDRWSDAALTRVAGRIQGQEFSVVLDDIGHWPGSGVVWIGTKRAPNALLQLASVLRSHAARNGCHQSTLPFHPQVSLYRNATRPVAIPPATPGWRNATQIPSLLYPVPCQNNRPED